MRILVISDAHGAVAPVLQAIDAHPEARDIFYLGDGVASLDDLPLQYPGRRFTFVRGNNDFGCDCPEECLLELGGIHIFATHGHRYGVYSGFGGLIQRGRSLGAQVVLCGHTHVAVTRFEDGVTLLNPGSIARPRSGPASYGALDIIPTGIVPLIIPANPRESNRRNHP